MLSRYTNQLGPFDRGFTNFFDDLFSSQFDWGQMPEVQFKCSTGKFPLTNAILDKETKDIELDIALAGYDKKDLSVKAEGNYLIVSSKKKENVLDDGKKFLYHDITQKSFEVKYQLPNGKYNLEKVEVEFKNGLLNLKIPAKESEKPKELAIK